MTGLADLAPILGVFFLAGLVKGASGFGLPVIAVGLLPFFAPVETALALNALVIVATNLQQIRQGGAYREGFSAAWALILGMALMVPVGALFAADLPARTLLLILGGFILLFVVSSLVNPALRTPPGWKNRTGFLTGLLSGFIGGLTSAPGPIFVAYIVSLHLTRPAFMTGLGFIMACFGTFAALSYAAVGVLRAEHVLPGLAAIPVAVLGMWVGNAWARRLAGETFRRAVLILLGIIGLMLIRRALG